MKNLNKKRELRNNKNVNNYECLLKRMLYCAGNGQELLSALGVTLVCHVSFFFSGSKSAFVNNRRVFKINGVVVGPGLISSFRTFGCSFGVSQMFLFSGIKSLQLAIANFIIAFSVRLVG